MSPRAGVIVGIHGIAKQQLGRHQMVDPWSRALADGLERATRRRTSLPPLDIAFYGDLFLPAGDGSKAMTDPSATLAELSDEELDELMLSVAEMGVDDAGVPDESKGYTRSPGVLQGLLRMLDRRFGPAAGAMCLGELRQVSRYLKSIEIRAGVTGRVAATMTPGCRVVVGHSLGSVVAMDYLRTHPERRVSLLVTLGSPLGLTFIRRGIANPSDPLTVPPNVDTWVNMRDPHDPVACVSLLDHWTGVHEVSVNNQSDAHAAERYLGKRQTGEAIAVALPELVR